MIVLDVLYVALATILVMVVLQISTFFVTRMIYPPEPKVIYRDVHVGQPSQQQPQQPQFQQFQQHMQQQMQQPFAAPGQFSQQPQQMQMQQPQQMQQLPPPVFTQPDKMTQQLPEYEPRKPASDSLRLDPELPAGLQETRPDGI
jgi:hypothetical protein